MTKISTTTTLEQALASGRLVLFEAELDPDETARRGIVLWTGIRDDIRGNHRKPADRKYYSKVRASLNQFCKDPLLDPEPRYLKPLKGYSDPALAYQWEIKVFLTPESRIFGRFLEANKFVALSHALRQDLDFDFHMARVRERWDMTLSSEAGVRSDQFKDVIK